MDTLLRTLRTLPASRVVSYGQTPCKRKFTYCNSVPVLTPGGGQFGQVGGLKTNDNGDTEAHLYRDGLHYARARLPVVLPIEGGAVEMLTSSFGIRRCHYVTADRVAQQLVPDPRSAEGSRACLDRERPALSR